MTTVIVKAYDKNDDLLGELPHFADVQVQDKLSDESSWTMKYDQKGINAGLLIQDQDISIKFWVDSLPVWEGMLEDDNWDEISEDQPLTIAGRSQAGMFEFAKVYPAAGVGTSPAEYAFVDATPGAIFLTLFNAAQDRGWGPNMTCNFTATHDSNGQAWASTLTITYKAGVSLLDIIKNFGGGQYADWRMGGKNLAMYNPRTFLGTHGPVIFRRNRDITSAPRSRSSRKLGTTYLVQGDEDVTVERTDPSGTAAYGRREQFLSQGGITDVGTLSVIGDLQLSVFGTKRLSKTHNIVFSDDKEVYDAQPKPWLQYLPGDYVNTDLTGDLEEYRLISMTVTMGTDNYLTGEIVLNDIFSEREVLLDDAITVLSGGTSSGGPATSGTTTTPPPDTTVPAKVVGLHATSELYISGREGIKFAQVTAFWNPLLTNTDGSDFTDFQQYEIRYWYTDSPSLYWTLYSSDATTAWSGLTPGDDLSYKVRAWDSNAHVGAFSDDFELTLADDTTPPPVASDPIVTNYLGLLRVEWDGLGSSGEDMPLDFKHTEVWYSEVSNFTPDDAGTFLADVLPAKGAANVAGLTYGTEYFARLVTVDEVGNKSEPSDQGSATPQQVVQTDIGGNVIDFSNIRFKDIGNLVADGSFELAATADLINPVTPVFQVVDNPTGVLTSPSPKVLKVAPGTANLIIVAETSASPDDSFASIYSFRQAGFTGTDAVSIVFDSLSTGGDVISTTLKKFDSTTNTSGGTWTVRQAGANAVSAVGTHSVRVTIKATVSSSGALLYLDQLEFRKRVGTLLIEDAAINNAKIADLAVNDAKIQSLSAGKITVGTLVADITVSSRIKTADTGARAELNSGGFGLWNSSNVQTVQFAAATGSAIIQGSIRSGSTGNRIDINPSNTNLPEIRFYPATGSNYAFINGFSPTGSAEAQLGMNTGQFTALGQTCEWRVFMTAGASAMEMVTVADQVRLGSGLVMTPDTIVLNVQRGGPPTSSAGFLTLASNDPGTNTVGAEIGFTNSSKANQAYVQFTQDGNIWTIGTWARSTFDSNSATQMDTNNATSAVNGFTWSFGVTMDSTVYPAVTLRDDKIQAYVMNALDTSGFDVSLAGNTNGASGMNHWGWR